MSPLNIWIITPEFAPYLSLGGIGTGLRGLAQVLLLRGHRVTAVFPIHGNVPIGVRTSSEIFLERFGLRIAIHEIVEANGLRIFLIEIPGQNVEYGGYGTDVSVNPLAARRSAQFALSVVEWIVQKHHSELIDIVHAHEWPTAMVLYLLRERLDSIATIFTIHSLAHQGLFPISALPLFGLGLEHATMERLELYGRISLLKGGLIAADRITTVSPTYAREIQSPERGELLDGVLRSRRDILSGIVNGIDTNSWNPATDSGLPAQFDARNLEGKRICKKLFCAGYGIDPDKPLVISLGRLVEQKGIDWLMEAAPAIMKLGANLVIAGAGEEKLEQLVKSTARQYSDRIIYCGYVADENARRLMAAGDYLVMPSRWEPCGIVQLQAMRYGVVPIARRTGGLADTIIDADERSELANGFVFDEPSAEALVRAMARAIARYELPEVRGLQRRGMQAALGWEGPVRSYEMVYRAAMQRAK